jgi:hypothetical protein
MSNITFDTKLTPKLSSMKENYDLLSKIAFKAAHRYSLSGVQKITFDELNSVQKKEKII